MAFLCTSAENGLKGIIKFQNSYSITREPDLELFAKKMAKYLVFL